MEETDAARYWCHACSQMVNPIMEVEIKCPFCQGGFVEEMAAGTDHHPDPDFGGVSSDSDRALSLWAPILLGMMNNPRRRRRSRRQEFEDFDDSDENDNINNHHHHEGETELDQLESIIRRRRRRSSATILQLLHGIQAGMLSDSENPESDNRDNRGRERVILINPFNQTIVVQGSYNSNNSQNQNQPIGSLGDYFVGPGLDLLLQHLAENDPNRYGTPPAQKEAVEAMPNVKIDETLQCSVCLDDFEIGAKAKEMPCKHKFHSVCILPWLDLHSSCPVCRYQLPSDESKLDAEGLRNSSNTINGESDNGNNDSGSSDVEGEGDGRNENGRRFSVPWPFSSLFSSSRSHSGNGNSSSSRSSTNANQSASRTDEN